MPNGDTYWHRLDNGLAHAFELRESGYFSKCGRFENIGDAGMTEPNEMTGWCPDCVKVYPISDKIKKLLIGLENCLQEWLASASDNENGRVRHNRSSLDRAIEEGSALAYRRCIRDIQKVIENNQ